MSVCRCACWTTVLLRTDEYSCFFHFFLMLMKSDPIHKVNTSHVLIFLFDYDKFVSCAHGKLFEAHCSLCAFTARMPH